MRLSSEIGDLIDEYYPGEQLTGKELFEVLDALALMTVFMVTSAPPEWVETFKKYFSQRLGEFEVLNKELDEEDD